MLNKLKDGELSHVMQGKSRLIVNQVISSAGHVKDKRCYNGHMIH